MTSTGLSGRGIFRSTGSFVSISTDIPSMKMVRFEGGHSIAVFDPDQWKSGVAQEKAYKLIAEDRAHFVVPADYTERSQLDVTVKGILGRIARASAAPELMAHF
jgi:hypothetical protein